MFREDFRRFCEVFQSFRKFFQGFANFSRLSDPFGPIGMHSDAFGSNWKRLDVFIFFLRFFGFLNRFSTFPDVIFTKDFFHGTISSQNMAKSKSTRIWDPPKKACSALQHAKSEISRNTSGQSPRPNGAMCDGSTVFQV